MNIEVLQYLMPVSTPTLCHTQYAFYSLPIETLYHSARADAPSEDPGPSGHGSLDQAFPEDLFQLGLHLKVLKAPMHGY